jgi:hypothetical protein
VEAAPEGDDRRPVCRDLRQLDRRLDGLSPGIRQEQADVVVGRRVREVTGQPLVDLEARLVVEDVLLGVDDLRSLLGNGRRHAGMGMPGVRDPDPAGVVEIPIAVEGDDPRPLPVVHDEVRVAGPDGGDAGAPRQPHR